MKKKPKTLKKSKSISIDTPQPLARDLDGYVHTAAGFLTQAQYLAIVADNPDVTFPDYDAIPLLFSPR